MTQVAYQPSMLDLADAGPTLGPLPGQVRRHRLSRGAWVDHLPGWVRGSDAVLDACCATCLARRAPQDVRLRGRRAPTAVLVRRRASRCRTRVLTEARAALTRHYAAELGEPFVTAGMCLYRTGRDSVAWHGDTHGRSAHTDTMVAIVSFGSPRPLLLRPRGGGGQPALPARATAT